MRRRVWREHASDPGRHARPASRARPSGWRAATPAGAGEETASGLEAAEVRGLATRCQRHLESNRASRGDAPCSLHPEQLKEFDELGYLVLPNCFSDEEMEVLRSEAEAHLRHRPPGGLAREVGRAAHRVRRPHLQRGVRHPWPPSAPDRAARAVLRRAGLHASVQDQRQGAVRRRGVAMAPGLRHLAARRRHARAARHEHLGVPGRGDAGQRPADVHPQEPQARHAGSRPRQGHHQLSAVDAGQRDGDQAGARTAASSRRPASPAPC